MKVVLFCGGLTEGDDLPKPMHTVGPRPLLWHVMRYYAHFGHNEFILCLGHGGHHIKDFFLHYDETASTDFVLRGGDVELLGGDMQDWTITFVDTGLDASIGERLRRVRRLVDGEEMFFVNYADLLTDAPLDAMVERFARPRQGRRHAGRAAAVGVPPRRRRRAGRDHVRHHAPGDAGVGERRLLRAPARDLRAPAGAERARGGRVRPAGPRRTMLAYRHRGYWQPADTVKERTAMEAAYRSGHRPWMRWEQQPA